MSVPGPSGPSYFIIIESLTKYSDFDIIYLYWNLHLSLLIMNSFNRTEAVFFPMQAMSPKDFLFFLDCFISIVHYDYGMFHKECKVCPHQCKFPPPLPSVLSRHRNISCRRSPPHSAAWFWKMAITILTGDGLNEQNTTTYKNWFKLTNCGKYKVKKANKRWLTFFKSSKMYYDDKLIG